MRVDLSALFKNEFDFATKGSGVNSTASTATARVEFGALTIIGFAEVA
jgi:hypothetical protein